MENLTRCTRILITGLEYFTEQVNETILASSNDLAVHRLCFNQTFSSFRRLAVLIKSIAKADLWYQIGGYAGRGRIYKLAHVLDKPVILHWVGTDVLQAKYYFKQHPEYLQSQKCLVHWAGAPWLVDELEEIGINAYFIPLPLKTVGVFLAENPPPSLPKEFRILTYMSDQRPEFYGWRYILHLAQEFPDVEIIVIGATGSFADDKPPNVHFLGWVKDTFPVFADCTVLVRMTEHDGYGGTVQEALSLGRYAIWSYPFPGAFEAKDYLSLRDHISYLYDRHKKGVLPINKAGRTYMLSNMNPTHLGSNIVQGLHGVYGGKYK